MNATVIFNGHLYINRGHFEQAALIIDGTIRAIGSNEAILAQAPANAERFDAQGRTIVPGFNDSHLHLLSVGENLEEIRLLGMTSIAQCEQTVRRYIAEHDTQDGQVLHGRGWNQDYFTDESRLLTRHDLDAWCPDHPLILQRACCHILVANTKALRMAGITAQTQPVDGGAIDLDENGELTGIIRENACKQILSIIPNATIEEKRQMLRTAMHYAAQCGITSVQTMDIRARDWQSTMQAYQNVQAENPTLRVYHQCNFMTPGAFQRFLDAGYHTGAGTPFNRVGPLKIFVDGSLGARTALMRQPYHDDPTTRGISTLTQEQTNRLVQMAVANGCQVATHAIGDGAVRQILNAYETVTPTQENPNRLSVIHVQITDYAMIERFARHNILAQVQPIFLHYDMQVVNDRVGTQLASTSYAFETMHKMGVHMSFGTDSPIEDMCVFDNLYCAVTRRNLQALPEGGFYPHECVDIYTAVDAYTIESAYTSFEENRKGRLLPGYYADLAVLSQNIFRIDPLELRNTKVRATMVDGRWVYQD